MRLKALYLKNFRKIGSYGLSEPTIVLNEDINVLAGANNTGKTSILKAVCKLLNAESIEANDFNFLQQNGNLEIKGDIHFSADEWQTFINLASDRQTASGISAQPDSRETTVFSEKIGNILVEFNRSAVFLNRRIVNNFVHVEIKYAPANKTEQILKAEIQNILTGANFQDGYQTPLYLDSKGNIEQRERFVPLSELEKADRVGQNRVRGLLYALKKKNPADFADFKQKLLAIFTEVDDIDVVHNEEIGEFELRIKEKMRDNGTSLSVDYDITYAGQGMQSLVLMLSAILLLKPRIVLMDEPEVHMHPTLIRDFARYIKQLSADIQFIMTTHSLVLMQEIGLDKVFLLANEAKGVRIRRVAQAEGWQEIIQNLGYPVEAFHYALQPKVIVFVEGRSDKEYLLAFAAKGGFAHLINEKTVAFVNMQGKGDRYKLVNLIQKLQEGVLTAPWLIILDRDEMRLEEIETFRQQYFGRYPERLHYFGKRQIENYLTDAAAVKKLVAGKIKDEALRQQWEQTDVQALLLQLCEEQKDEMYEKFATEFIIKGSILQTKEIRDLVKNSAQSVKDFAARLNALMFGRVWEIGEKAGSMRDFFAQEWETNKLDMCDGRTLLKSLRRYVQANFRVSFTDDEIIDTMEVIPAEIADLFNKIIAVVS